MERSNKFMVFVLILNLMNGALVGVMAWQEFTLVGKFFDALIIIRSLGSEESNMPNINCNLSVAIFPEPLILSVDGLCFPRLRETGIGHDRPASDWK